MTFWKILYSTLSSKTIVSLVKCGQVSHFTRDPFKKMAWCIILTIEYNWYPNEAVALCSFECYSSYWTNSHTALYFIFFVLIGHVICVVEAVSFIFLPSVGNMKMQLCEGRSRLYKVPDSRSPFSDIGKAYPVVQNSMREGLQTETYSIDSLVRTVSLRFSQGWSKSCW